MSTTPESKLFKLIQGMDLPDLKADYRYPLPLTMKSISAHNSGFKALLEALGDDAAGNRLGSNASKTKDAMRLILMNFADSIFTRKWTIFPGDKAAYSKGKYLSDKLFLGFNRVQDCLRVLEENALVDKRKGYVDTYGKRLPNKYFPTIKLQEKIWDAYLSLEQDITPPYVEVKESRLVANEDDIKKLTIINEFMKDQTWASKGPIILKYIEPPIKGGRVYTNFQNLPSNKIPVRINTLINNNSIVEIDYTANHIRMALAFNGVTPPDDPYSAILELVSDCKDREQVKVFINRSLGADDEVKAFNACKDKRVNKILFNKLKEATHKLYPKLILFKSVGTLLQSIEGQMSIDIMLSAEKNNIAVLPVHDSYCVEESNEQWLLNEMQQVWKKHNNFDAAIKIKKA